jgi:hypothetical protein
MRGRFGRAWSEAWFRPCGPSTLRATRALLALHALWIVLSRPDLPEIVTWPREFWRGVDASQALRFGIGPLPAGLEWALYLLLPLFLVMAVGGPAPRGACIVSATLLYHFAPFEEILAGMPHTFFGGLTVPVLGLFVVGCAETPRRGQPSSENRWPVVLIRLLFSFNYFFAAVAKLRFSGLAWFTAENMRRWCIENGAVSGAPWARWVAESPTLCSGIALGTGVVELLFPLAAFSSTVARLLVPMALVGHLGIAQTMGIWFPSLPLLLLYVDWDGLGPTLERALHRLGRGFRRPAGGQPEDLRARQHASHLEDAARGARVHE